MRINVAVPEAHVSAPVLDAALESVTRLDESLIRKGELEPFDPDSPQAKWKPEPPGDGEHMDHGLMVKGRGWGDCDDLAPWHAASLRATGEDPDAVARVRKSGPKRWHAIVQRGDGSIDDPSLDAGMPGPGVRGVYGAAQPLMFHPAVSGVGGVGSYVMRPQLALRPVTDRGGQLEAWQARTDLPWHSRRGRSPTDIAMVSLHASPISDQALVGSIEGAIALGEASGHIVEDHLDRLRCIADMLQGATYEDCADEYGPEHAAAASHVVGSFFGKLRRGISRGIKKFGRGAVRAARGITRDVVLPLAPLAARAIPGVGPGVSMALQTATPALQKALARKEHLPQYAPQYTPQYAPQYTPQYAPQYTPQYAPQYTPQYSKPSLPAFAAMWPGAR